MVGFHSLGALTAASALLPFAALASPLQSNLRSLNARQNNYFVVHGIEEGGVQPRLNIRDLERKPENKDLWTLYILALQRLQAVDQQDKISYYQVAGIHGQPWYEWDGVAGRVEDDPVKLGYCPHNGNLFATWHRPYIMLWEQLLHSHATAVVNEISDATVKARFREAVKKFRTPYWDWAAVPPAGEHVLPASVYSDTLSITYPNGTAATIRNPLRTYIFHPLIPDDFDDNYDFHYYEWNRTLYRPIPEDSPTPYDDVAKTLEVLDGNLGYARSGIWNLFKYWQKFDRFSNQAPGFDTRAGNLETIHGSIHSSFERGHMAPAATSAFDPVFWLHHANVDRQIALWQKVFPDTYVEEGRSPRQSTFTINGGNTVVGPDFPLTPFHRNAQGDFWTSNLVKDITKLGYTYPELASNPTNASLIATIRTLYDETASASKLSRRQEGNGTETVRHYNAIVKLPTGFRATLFVGEEPSSTPQNWPAEKNFAGAFSTTFNIGSGSKDDVLTGLISLDLPLATAHDNGKLGEVGEDAIVDFLKSGLHFKIESHIGKEVPIADVKDFGVEVFSRLETVPASKSVFPEVLETKDYPELTFA